MFHSCGDRHCPICSGRKRYDFAARAEQLILPGVSYYQVVFTLPEQLSELALANRMEMAELLFSSAWKSLRKTITAQQDYDAAAMMVLHTWNQRLDSHWHVHALVPGGGPSVSGGRWKQAEAPEEVANSDGFYLVDCVSLRESFRKHAISHLKRLRRRGKLHLGGKFAHLQEDDAWETFCGELESVDWVSFIQPPPTEPGSATPCSADQVIRYLTRYLTGGPISDSRIVSADGKEVTFLAREGKRTGGEREQVPVTLSSVEFTRQWCLHIQPQQLTKTRYFGGWSGKRQRKYLERCRQLLACEQDDLSVEALTESSPSWLGDTSAEDQPHRCPSCEQESLRLIGEIAKPSWRKVLWHLDARCPDWYASAGQAELRGYLTEEYGIDYEDWYREMVVESAIDSPQLAPPEQLYFPGLGPSRDFLLESY